MSDIFTLKSVRLTPELGMALKNFRIENGVTATDINKNFNRAASYITKLEKGEIKKIDGKFLCELCDYISKSEDGLKLFLSKLSRNYSDFSDETKISILNIDDLLIEHPVPSNLIKEITSYLMDHNISIPQLANKINANEDIRKKPDYDYDSLPENIWHEKDSIYEHAAIRLSIPIFYLEDLLNGTVLKIHKVIAHAILYSMYRLGDEEDPHASTFKMLRLYHIISAKNVISLSKDDIDDMLDDLDPDAVDAMKKVFSGLKIATAFAKNLGSKRIQQISNNMNEDLGFYFAYISQNMEELQKQPVERKQEFINELKLLIKKYSQNNSGFNMYE